MSMARPIFRLICRTSTSAASTIKLATVSPELKSIATRAPGGGSRSRRSGRAAPELAGVDDVTHVLDNHLNGLILERSCRFEGGDDVECIEDHVGRPRGGDDE